MTHAERLLLTRKLEVGSPIVYISVYLSSSTYSLVPEGQRNEDYRSSSHLLTTLTHLPLEECTQRSGERNRKEECTQGLFCWHSHNNNSNLTQDSGHQFQRTSIQFLQVCQMTVVAQMPSMTYLHKLIVLFSSVTWMLLQFRDLNDEDDISNILAY